MGFLRKIGVFDAGDYEYDDDEIYEDEEITEELVEEDQQEVPVKKVIKNKRR